MEFSIEIQEIIKRLFSNDEEMMNKLLQGDVNAIRLLTIDNNIGHDEVLDALPLELIMQVPEEYREKLLNLRVKSEKGKLYYLMLDEIHRINYENDQVKAK